MITVGHLRVTVGNHSNSMRQLRVTVNHPRVAIDHLKVTKFHFLFHF